MARAYFAFPVATNWAAVSVGEFHSCGVDADHDLWCWGNDAYGQLGRGFQGPSATTPVLVSPGGVWADVSARAYKTCATRTDGSLWCWGANGGTLGDGTVASRPAPVSITTSMIWRQVGTGGDSSCATRTDGTLWCWGWNDYGAVGDGDGWYETPVQSVF